MNFVSSDFALLNAHTTTTTNFSWWTEEWRGKKSTGAIHTIFTPLALPHTFGQIESPQLELDICVGASLATHGSYQKQTLQCWQQIDFITWPTEIIGSLGEITKIGFRPGRLQINYLSVLFCWFVAKRDGLIFTRLFLQRSAVRQFLCPCWQESNPRLIGNVSQMLEQLMIHNKWPSRVHCESDVYLWL